MEADSKPIARTDSDSDLEDETRIQRLIRGIKLWTIEPALLIHMTASFMGNLMATDLAIERACKVNLGYSNEICDLITARLNTTGPNATLKYEDQQIQDLIAPINTWKQVIDNSFPVIMVLFLGAWSDIYGRKLPFLLAMIGYVLRYMGLLICVYFPSLNAEAVTMIGAFPIALTGGRTAISMALYSYITDTTSIKDRTLRTGILTAVRTFGKSAGSALGGYLRRNDYGFTVIFGVGGGMDVVAFAFTLFFIRNTRNPNVQKSSSKVQIMKDIFNFRNIIESAKAFFKWRENGARTKLFLLVFILVCTMAPMQGEESNLYIFARYKLNWDAGDFGYYNTYRMLVAFIGGVVSMGLLSHILRMSDPAIGVLSCCSQIGASLIYAFAENDTMMYIAPVVDILNGTMIIASRSMISKTIERHEIGKVNSFIGTIDSLTPLPANPIYSAIYDATKFSFAGAFFLVSVGLTIPPLFIFIWFTISAGITIKYSAEDKIQDAAFKKGRNKRGDVPSLEFSNEDDLSKSSVEITNEKTS